MKRTRSTKGTPVNTAEQRLSYQGTQSSVESITIEIQDTPAVYFTFKYTWILIYMTEGQKKREKKNDIMQRFVCSLHHHHINVYHGFFRWEWLFEESDWASWIAPNDRAGRENVKLHHNPRQNNFDKCAATQMTAGATPPIPSASK